MLMIAEDNASMRRMIRSLVEDIVSEIVECSDGSEAIETYERHRPEWVLMDIGMHPMDGLTATREIVSRHPEAKVVIVTQYQDAQTRETALASGAWAFVGKDDLMALRKLVSGETPA